MWWSSAEDFGDDLTFKSQAFTFYLVCKFMPVEILINIKLNLKRKALEYYSPPLPSPNLPLVSLLPEGLSV